MHPFFHTKYYVLYAMLVVGVILVLFFEYHYLSSTVFPSVKTTQTSSPEPTRTTTKNLPSPTISYGQIPPRSQISPAYADILKISISKDGFDQSATTMSQTDLLTFLNEDTLPHSLDIEGHTVDVLVHGMTGHTFKQTGAYTITDLTTKSRLSIMVRE